MTRDLNKLSFSLNITINQSINQSINVLILKLFAHIGSTLPAVAMCTFDKLDEADRNVYGDDINILDGHPTCFSIGFQFSLSVKFPL